MKQGRNAAAGWQSYGFPISLGALALAVTVAAVPALAQDGPPEVIPDHKTPHAFEDRGRDPFQLAPARPLPKDFDGSGDWSLLELQIFWPGMSQKGFTIIDIDGDASVTAQELHNAIENSVLRLPKPVGRGGFGGTHGLVKLGDVAAPTPV